MLDEAVVVRCSVAREREIETKAETFENDTNKMVKRIANIRVADFFLGSILALMKEILSRYGLDVGCCCVDDKEV